MKRQLLGLAGPFLTGVTPDLVGVIPANWGKYGLAAGPIRNREMAEIGDVLIAIKTSGKGTQSMIREARLRGKRVIEYH